MEIKVICPCGTKYKFDVTPVNGRMPFAVACPSCGVDGTGAANEILRQSPAAAAQAAVAVSAVPLTAAPAPTPGTSSAPAPVPSTPAPAGGLRINRPAPAEVPSAPPAGPAPFPASFAAAAAQSKRTGTRKGAGPEKLKKVFGGIFAAIVALGVGYRWFRRIRAVVGIAAAVGGAAASDGGSGGEAKNLWYDNASIVFVKHTNQMEIAEECKAFWKEKWHKSLAVSETQQDGYGNGEYELVPPHNGWVRIMSGLDWKPAEIEAVAQHLSEKFGTEAFEWRTESFADTYHFGVYEQGARKFHAQMDVNIKKDDADEVVTTEGKEWMIAHGYKAKKDFKEFDVLDADKITRRLGMKLWDEKDGTEVKGLLMKETGA